MIFNKKIEATVLGKTSIKKGDLVELVPIKDKTGTYGARTISLENKTPVCAFWSCYEPEEIKRFNSQGHCINCDGELTLSPAED